MLIGFLQAKGRPCEGVPWQGPGWRRVYRAGRQRVAGRSCAVQGRGPARLEQKVSAETQKMLLLMFKKTRAVGEHCVISVFSSC